MLLNSSAIFLKFLTLGSELIALGGLATGFLWPIGLLVGGLNITDKETQILLTAISVKISL